MSGTHILPSSLYQPKIVDTDTHAIHVCNIRLNVSEAYYSPYHVLCSQNTVSILSKILPSLNWTGSDVVCISKNGLVNTIMQIL